MFTVEGVAHVNAIDAANLIERERGVNHRYRPTSVAVVVDSVGRLLTGTQVAKGQKRNLKLPQGGIDGDSLFGAASREVQEETGLVIPTGSWNNFKIGYSVHDYKPGRDARDGYGSGKMKLAVSTLAPKGIKECLPDTEEMVDIRFRSLDEIRVELLEARTTQARDELAYIRQVAGLFLGSVKLSPAQ